MNNFTIPTILIATVLVAGVFAFVPIEEASTVHTTIQASQLVFDDVSLALVPDANNLLDNNQIEIECGATAAADQDRPFIVISLTIETILDAAADDFNIDSIEVDNLAITDDGALTLTDIPVALAATTNAYQLVPVDATLTNLAADGELDLIIEQVAGDLSTDDVGAFATVLKQSDTVCALTTGGAD